MGTFKKLAIFSIIVAVILWLGYWFYSPEAFAYAGQDERFMDYHKKSLGGGMYQWTGGLPPFTQNLTGHYVPYILTETGTEIHVVTGIGSMNFNKDNCGFKLYEKNGMSTVIANNFTADFYVDDVMQSPTCTVSSITEENDTMQFYFMNSDLKTIINASAYGIEWTYQTENTSGGNQTYKIMEYCEDCDVDSINEDVIFLGDYHIDMKNNTHDALMDITDTGDDIETHLEKEVADGEMLDIDPTFGFTIAASARFLDSPPCDGLTPVTLVDSVLPIVYIQNTDGGSCSTSDHEWDITSIPDSATVISGEIVFDHRVEGTPYPCHLRSIENQPSTRTDNQRWDDIRDGTFFYTSSSECNKSIALDAHFAFTAAMKSDLEANLSVDWWAVGIEPNSYSTPAFDRQQDIWDASLQVVYTQSAPSVPINVIAINTTDININVDWDEPESGNAIDYNVFVKNLTAGEESFTEVASDTVLTFFNYAVTDMDSSLEFRINAENSTGHAGQNATVVFPARINDLDLTVDVGQISGDWADIINATKYQVFRDENFGGLLFFENRTTSDFLDTTVTQGLNYLYKVRAIWENGTTSDYSFGALSEGTSTLAFIDVPPQEPENLSVSDVALNQMTIQWDEPSILGTGSLLGYLIEIDEDCDDTFVELEGNTGNSDTEYTAVGLLDETCYKFRLKTITTIGTSEDFSNTAFATTPPAQEEEQGGGAPSVPPPASVGGGGGGGGGGGAGRDDAQPINIANLRIFDHEDVAFLGQVDNDNRVRFEWTSGVNLQVTSIMPREPTPFNIMFQAPVQLIANPTGVTEAVVLYDIQTPDNQCVSTQTNDCVFLEEYIIPMVARIQHEGTEFTVNFNLIRNLSGDTEFVTFALLGIIGVPIIGLVVASTRRKKKK